MNPAEKNGLEKSTGWGNGRNNHLRQSYKTNRKTTLHGLQNREVAAKRLSWFYTIVFLQRVRRYAAEQLVNHEAIVYCSWII